MAEPFKNWIVEATIRKLGREVSATVPGFDLEVFVALATRDLETHELKARVRQVGAALRPQLARDWEVALDQLVRATPSENPNKEGATTHTHWWPVLDLIETQGLGSPEASVAALSRLTPTFSAEFAVRPYLEAAPEPTWRRLEACAEHPDLNVRRWVSEGSRPRLPWGMQLRSAVRDPSRGLAILERLVDDPSSYVRRSVANHLGDVAKDHPALAVATAKRWLRNENRRPMVKHALRDLLKKGDAAALSLMGGALGSARVEAVRIRPGKVFIGGECWFEAELVATASGSVRTDLVWEWPGARDAHCAKVFRGETRDVSQGDPWTFRHRFSLKPVSTRAIREGEHRVKLRVNGEDVARATFAVRVDDGGVRV